MFRALLALTLVLSVGCSRMFMETLPSDHFAGDPPVCTTSTFWPAVDIGWASGDAAGIVYAIDRGGPERNAVIGIHLISAAIAIASATWGARQLQRCNRAEEAFVASGFTTSPVVAPVPDLPPDPAPVDLALRCAMPTATSKGVCGRGLRECQQRRQVLRDAGAALGGCAPSATAMCLVAIRRDGTRFDSCFPTTAGCQAQRDLLAGKPDKYSSVSTCTGAEATIIGGAVADPDDTPTPEPSGGFHCTEVPDGTGGSCTYTAAGCEADRDALLASGAEATPCTLNDAAVCFNHAAGKRCFPTIAQCDASRPADAGSCLLRAAD